MKLKNRKKYWPLLSLSYMPGMFSFYSLRPPFPLPGSCFPLTTVWPFFLAFGFYSKATFPVKFPRVILSKRSTHILLSLFFFFFFNLSTYYYNIYNVLSYLWGRFHRRKETLIKERHILKYIKMAKDRAYTGIRYNEI